MVIHVSAYDPAWPGLASRAIDEVRGALAGRIDAVEHIGSTAVPGLAAKPVIDLMAAAPSLDAVADAAGALAAIGFDRHDNGMPGRLFFRREGAPVSYHLHVVTAASWDTRNQRLFRDHLRAHPADRDAYGRLKRELTGADGDTYTRAKTALIQRVVDDARAARGLPLVNVWEE
ncbi:GrpB family protein [Asanoa siamensis]|nr:GrpB family protein [Asanoa siamensis]